MNGVSIEDTKFKYPLTLNLKGTRHRGLLDPGRRERGRVPLVGSFVFCAKKLINRTL